MSLLLISIFSFLAAVSLIVILFMLPMAVQDSAQARIKRRLTTIGRFDQASRAEMQSILKTSIYSEIPWVNELLSRWKFIHSIDLRLERANVDMTPGMFLLCSVGAGGVAFFLAAILGQPTVMCFIFGLIAMFCPSIYLQFIIWKRLRKFLEQFPDGLDMIAQSLQAGLGLTQAMVFVAKEVPDPMGTEFSVFIEEVNLGLPLGDALKKFEERMNLPEVRLFNTALMVQREVGGSLAELLTKLSSHHSRPFPHRALDQELDRAESHQRLDGLLRPAVSGVLYVYPRARDDEQVYAKSHRPEPDGGGAVFGNLRHPGVS